MGVCPETVHAPAAMCMQVSCHFFACFRWLPPMPLPPYSHGHTNVSGPASLDAPAAVHTPMQFAHIHVDCCDVYACRCPAIFAAASVRMHAAASYSHTSMGL